MKHKLEFIRYQLLEAKKYSTSAYAHDHIDKSIEVCTELINNMSIGNTEERV